MTLAECDNYVNNLEKMYEKYYTGKDGHCQYFDECKKCIGAEPCKFSSDKAMVGEKYGNDSSVPKIVFVGLEGLSKDEDRLDTYRNVKNIVNPSHKVYNSHYKGGRYVLAYLLKGIADESQPQNALKTILKKYNETTEYLTLLNCYKCAFSNKSQGLPHTNEMEEHCQELLFKEIEILKPDIVVFQVIKGRPKDFESKLDSIFGSGLQISGKDGDNKTAAYLYYPQPNQPLIWIWTYHGSGDPNPKKRAWVNDNKNGNVYINKQLKPVLDKAIEMFKKSRKQT